jgi:hypothetical protein
MRLRLLTLLLSSFAAYAQVSAELKQAQQEAEKIRMQIEAGVLPRARLADIQEKLADAQDDETLRHTLYGSIGVEELTEEQAADMIAAAERRVARQQSALDKAKALVAAGATPAASLVPYEEELDRRRKAVDLAMSRAGVLREIAAMARREQEESELAQTSERRSTHAAAFRYDGDGEFSTTDLARIRTAFQKEFSRNLPVSAHGMSAVHRALGFDHRGRVDIALNPDQREGAWLLSYLERERIPYFAFRRAISGSATGPHIHVGTPSPRLSSD